MHILIVEDSALQAALLRRLFEGAGYQVSVASDGREALRKLAAEGPPVAIVSDIDMPEMNGYELCRAVKSAPETRQVPVILLTNLSDTRNVIEGLQAGADNYVTKPYDGKRLLARVESLRLSPALFTNNAPEQPVEVSLAGETFTIEAGRGQILNLLLSTFEGAVWQNQKLRQSNDQLQVMHREMAEKKEQLERAIEKQNRFIGMAAHDMRNPLTAMLGYSRLLLDHAVGPLEPAQAKFVGSIHKASEALLNLVTELLEISEIDSGNLRLDLAEVDLAALVRDAVEMNGLVARNKNISVVADVEGPALLRVDSGKLDQVLNNLLTNAIKFSHPGTEVRVRLRRTEDGGWEMAVIDQGQGIPLAEQPSLFQPFQRTSVRGTAGEKSTGLGLAIVKRIVEGHGAAISVESKSGEGSTFTVTFPPSGSAVPEPESP